MTKEPIMIDGVDVSECEHINACDKKMKCIILQDDICEINPYCEGSNCYYKQYKRKEQECEELKEELIDVKWKIEAQDIELNNNEEQLDQLKKENEKLKKNVERWKSNFNGKVSAIEELIQIIQQALKDFSIEVGTPQYDRLLNGAKSLGIEVKDSFFQKSNLESF